MARNPWNKQLYSTTLATGAGYSSGDIDVSLYKNLAIDLDITAITGATPTWTWAVQRKDPASGKYFTLWTSAAHAAASTDDVDLGPDMQAAVAGNLIRINSLPGVTIKVIGTPGGTVSTFAATVSVIGAY